MIGSLIGLAYRPPSSPERRGASVDQVAALEGRVDALELACAGMWDLLKAKHGHTDEEIVAHIHAVDARDGQMDGRAGPADKLCPSCGRRLITRSRKRCVWCGVDLKMSPL